MADAAARQFEIGRVVSDIIRTIRGTLPSIWPVVAGFVLAPQVALAVIEMIIVPTRVDRFLQPSASPFSQFSPAIAGPFAALGLIAGLVGLAGTIALIYSSANFLNGKNITPAEAIGQAGRLFLPVFGLSILIGLGTGLALLIFIIPGLFLAVAWSVVVPVRIMEPIGAIDAIGRGYRLTSSFRWPIVGVFLIMIGIYLGTLLVLGLVSGILSLIGLSLVATVVLAPLLQALIVIASATIPAAVYHELLRLKEGGGSTVAEVFS
jgi:hypothetical protein